MKKFVGVFALAVLSLSAFAQEVPLPLNSTSRAVVGGGSYQIAGQADVRPQPQPQPQPQPRPDQRRPETRSDECEVIMVDAYHRVVFRYTGLPDLPSGLCRGPLVRCQHDIFAERVYGGLCYQTVLR